MLQLNYVSLLGLGAIMLNLLLVVNVLIQPARDKVAKALLVFLLLCLTALIMSHLYRYRVTRLFVVFPHFSGISLLLTYCLGPILYTYVRRMALDAKSWNQRYWYLHWLLPVALGLYLLPHFGRSAEEKFISFRSEDARTFRSYLYLANYLQIMVYLFFCQKPLASYQRRIVDCYSDIQLINLKWLKKVCYGLVLVMVLGVVTVLLQDRNSFWYAILLVVSALLTIALAMTALQHKQLTLEPMNTVEPRLNQEGSQQDPDDVKSDHQDAHLSPKYSRSGLQADGVQYNLDRLRDLMESNQYFLNDTLSLSDLANALNISPHHLSQLLNEQLNASFYDYVNELRVNYAKKILSENGALPVIEVAYTAGFSSKSTFYSAFKRVVGLTPAQYRKQLTGHKRSETKT